MKFKLTVSHVVDPLADEIKVETKDYHFLRNLNTEKTFRDETGAELQAQLTTLYKIQAAFEADNTNPENVRARMDINFAETRHEVLKYMFAELNDRGILVQNETTREHFEQLDDMDEPQALLNFFRGI